MRHNRIVNRYAQNAHGPHREKYEQKSDQHF